MGLSRVVLDGIICQSVLPDWLNDLETIASLIGAVAAVWTFLLVAEIKKKYLYKARYPELRDTLTALAAELNRSIFTFERSRDQIQVILAKCDAAVANIASKASGELKRSATSLRRRLAVRGGAAGHRHWTLATLAELTALIETMIHTSKDMHWE